MIDSFGGDLHAGYKIYDYLKGRNDVYCNVVGNCMSAAVLVLLGVKKENRTANEHARFLIHRPLLEYNGQLTQAVAKKVDSAIEDETKKLMEVYKKELDASDTALYAMLDNEQVFGSRQAQAMGFISSVNENAEQEAEEAEAMQDVMYNQLLITKKMEKNDKLKTCIEALKDLFAGVKFGNAKTVATVDGKELKVETDSDIKKGCKVDAENGSYTLGDNRTIIVKNGVIESIEEPKKAKPNGGEDEEKKELKEKVKNLSDENASLQAELEKAKNEIKDFKALKEQMQGVKDLIDNAGGIEAVLNTVSNEPKLKSDFDEGEEGDAYSFIKNLGNCD